MLPFADGETTTFPANPSARFLGELVPRHHGVKGKVYALGRRRIRIDNFHYDGAGPDAFFWTGTNSEYIEEPGVTVKELDKRHKMCAVSYTHLTLPTIYSV